MPATIAGSPRSRRLVLAAEPVPAFLRVGRRRLRRVGDEERLLLRDLVHARAGGEIVRRLRAAVQHHDEGQALPAITARNVELVGPAAGLARKGVLVEGGAGGQGRPGARHPAADKVVEVQSRRELADATEDVAQGTPDPVAAVGPCFGRGRRPRRGPGSARFGGGQKVERRPVGLSALRRGVRLLRRRPPQHRECLLEAAFAGEARRLGHVDFRERNHDDVLNWCQRRRSRKAALTAALACKAPRTWIDAIVSRASSGGMSSARMARPRTWMCSVSPAVFAASRSCLV